MGKMVIKMMNSDEFVGQGLLHSNAAIIRVTAMSLRDFQVLGVLGQGAYSCVYRARRAEDGLIYALKCVKFMRLSHKERDNAFNQIRILASLRHPNIIGYRQAFFDEPTQSLYIVMEYATNGDLEHLIAAQLKTNSLLPEAQIWRIFEQAVRGLAELHRLSILHRDIKPANILLHEDGSVKLADMNVSRITQRGDFNRTSTGTPFYASPQIWKDLAYGTKSDVWSLGCVLYQLISLRPPFRGKDMEQLYKKVTRGIYPRLPSQYSQDLSSVIRALLQVDPQQRPSCDKLLMMPQVQRRISLTPCETGEQSELLRTIRGDSLHALGQALPKPNYQPLKIKKIRGIKSLIDSLQERELCEVESLPLLERQRKIPSFPEHSQRPRDKHLLFPRQRKKSEIGTSRSILEINGLNFRLQQSKELKLPRVANRYQKGRNDQVSKQGSLKCYRPLQH